MSQENSSDPEANAAQSTSPLKRASNTTAREAIRLSAEGDALFRNGQLRPAADKFRQAIQLNPSEPAFYGKLAAVAERLDEPEIAKQHLTEALRMRPDYAPAHYALGVCCHRLGAMDEALHHSAAAARLSPGRADYQLQLAIVLFAVGKTDESLALIQPLIEAGNTNRWLAWLFSRIAPRFNQEDQALELLQRALHVPGLSSKPDGKPLIYFSIVTLLDRMKRYDEAFENARLGNEMIRAAMPRFDTKANSAWISRKINFLSAERLKSLPQATVDSRRVVLIVGMPRSGTTLVEQILASHPAIAGGNEMPHLGRMIHTIPTAAWARGEPYPECLAHVTQVQVDTLAAQYLSAINRVSADSVFVTDKMPLNSVNLELAELLLPRAHVIHCVRNPLDTCLSCYMTNFAKGNPFKYDLTDLGVFYHDYVRMTHHWRSVLTLPVLQLSYEELILNQEAQTRRMLEFLGLPWDERCMKFHQNKRRAISASEDQVKRPLYDSSVGRWKNYEKHLGSLISALGNCAVT